jgi:hypothetical protein
MTVKKQSVAKKVPSVKKKAPAKKKKSALAPELCFWVYEGPVVDSLPNLLLALEAMTEEQFAYHTTRSGNDFARWVREVLLCEACADELEKVESRTEAIGVLKKKKTGKK